MIKTKNFVKLQYYCQKTRKMVRKKSCFFTYEYDLWFACWDAI